MSPRRSIWSNRRIEQKLADGFRFRTASNKDREAAVALVKLVLPQYGLRYEINDNDADLENIQATYADRGGTFEVLEDARGVVVGTFAFEPLGGGVCRLRKMYLAPELKGRGLGFGAPAARGRARQRARFQEDRSSAAFRPLRPELRAGSVVLQPIPCRRRKSATASWDPR